LLVVENAMNDILTVFATFARFTESPRGAATAVAPVPTRSADIANAAVPVRTLDSFTRLLYIPLSQFVIRSARRVPDPGVQRTLLGI